MRAGFLLLISCIIEMYIKKIEASNIFNSIGCFYATKITHSLNNDIAHICFNLQTMIIKLLNKNTLASMLLQIIV